VASADLLAVDAPLAPPYRGLRPVEKLAVRQLGARLLPGGLPAMRALARLGYSIKFLAWEAGTAVVETHPGTIYKVLEVDKQSMVGAAGGKHAADALAAAVAAACYVQGRATLLESEGERMVFPKRNCREKVWGLLAP